MVIIRCNALLSAKAFAEEYEGLVGMAKRGVILLPNYFELLNEVPPDTEVLVVRPDAPADVAEVKRARWIKAPCSERDGDANCSNCNHWDWSDCHYCSKCGAKMDGDKTAN